MFDCHRPVKEALKVGRPEQLRQWITAQLGQSDRAKKRELFRAITPHRTRPLADPDLA